MNEIIRIGDKLISRRKLERLTDEILSLRAVGLSQAEVAVRLGVERTFISRLESYGEVGKGERIAVVGFPVKNKEELTVALQQEGVDFILLMTEDERWDFVRRNSGLELINQIMEWVTLSHRFDHIIVIGSGQRIKIIAAMLDRDVIGYDLGMSPIQEDRYVDPQEIVTLIRSLRRRKQG